MAYRAATDIEIEQSQARLGPPLIGHNQPPSQIDSAQEAMTELSAFLKEKPVIQTADEAKTAGGWIERTRIALQEARRERDTKTAPHNDALKKIREIYDLVREKTGNNRGGALQAAYDEIKRRLFCYTEEERERREAEAEIARQKAAEALRIAQEAAFRRDEAIEDASVGAESDVGGLIVNADATHRAAAKAVRHLAVAQRDTNVRVPSMMGGRSIAPRERRVLVVATAGDAARAVIAIGLTDRIRTAIVQSAKEFEDAYGELPEGVTETFERSL